MNKKILSIIKYFILILLIFLSPGCKSKDPLTPEERAWLNAHDGKIRLAPAPGYAPFDYVDRDGTAKGMSADYVALLEKN